MHKEERKLNPCCRVIACSALWVKNVSRWLAGVWLPPFFKNRRCLLATVHRAGAGGQFMEGSIYKRAHFWAHILARVSNTYT